MQREKRRNEKVWTRGSQPKAMSGDTNVVSKDAPDNQWVETNNADLKPYKAQEISYSKNYLDQNLLLRNPGLEKNKFPFSQ